MVKIQNILITGYYNKNNLGDDLFLELAKKIFTKNVLLNCKYISTGEINSNNINELSLWLDTIILFGGATINNYFLDKIILVKEYCYLYLNKKIINVYAIGVCCNCDRQDILLKLDIFDYVIFRNKYDYNYFKGRLLCNYIPDIVFLLKPNREISRFFKKKGEKCGFFLSQTMPKDYNYLLKLIRDFLANNIEIILFSMCTNNLETEDDRILNKQLINLLTPNEQKMVSLSDNVILGIKNLDYAICYRYHAHILCIINKIPFLSISQTPKVLNLLKDNTLNILKYCNIDYLLKNRQQISDLFANIYTNCNKLAQVYKKYDYLNINKKNRAFYFNLSTYFNSYYEILTINKIEAYKILFKLTGNIDSKYLWGLNNKNWGENDIKWILLEEMKQNNKYVYKKIAENLDFNFLERGIDFYYMDQNDMSGVHRSGWQYVVDNLETRFGSFNKYSIQCDLYLDRTFHWNFDRCRELNIIPYKNQWIGFIHHTCNTSFSPNNVVNMFKNMVFLTSLENCRGLYVFSNYLRLQVLEILNSLEINIPVHNLIHPTKFVSYYNEWHIDKYLNNIDKRLIQIGGWLRNLDIINKVECDIKKTILIGKKMDYVYNNFKPDENIEIIRELDNFEYDILLTKNIVIINLVDCSAVNTLLECIVRNTPILVNPLPAIIEYLGKGYPLYYENSEQVKNMLNIDLIKKAYKYLKDMDKSCLHVDYFLKSFENTLVNLSI
jgi:polysaccharide pyruvyl transferase WcaK-like protein